MKPGDLALSIRDLFAVLVPGALFLLLIPATSSWLLGSPLEMAEDWPHAILFLTAAYAVGSLIGAAAGFLDPLAERIYRPGGWFSPVLLVDGVMAGIWNREGDEVTIEPFAKIAEPVREAAEAEAARLPGAPVVKWV